LKQGGSPSCCTPDPNPLGGQVWRPEKRGARCKISHYELTVYEECAAVRISSHPRTDDRFQLHGLHLSGRTDLLPILCDLAQMLPGGARIICMAIYDSTCFLGLICSTYCMQIPHNLSQRQLRYQMI